MSHTNQTPFASLPLFVGTDKPAWLTDFNAAMSSIDTSLSNQKSDIDANALAIAALQNMIGTVYPIGSVYMSVNSTDPGTLFGGTWTRIKDTFLLAAGDEYTAGSTGGEAVHKLTVNELPAHNHWFWTNPSGGVGPGSYGNEAYTCQSAVSTSARHGMTSDTGGNASHNNMPPYLTVYMWRRTA